MPSCSKNPRSTASSLAHADDPDGGRLQDGDLDAARDHGLGEHIAAIHPAARATITTRESRGRCGGATFLRSARST
jgi:hypothetical protein